MLDRNALVALGRRGDPRLSQSRKAGPNVERETRPIVRRLIAGQRVSGANSPVQVGGQTCTRLLVFRENVGYLPDGILEDGFSATGLNPDIAKKLSNIAQNHLQTVTSLTTKTSWRRKVDSNM